MVKTYLLFTLHKISSKIFLYFTLYVCDMKHFEISQVYNKVLRHNITLSFKISE